MCDECENISRELREEMAAIRLSMDRTGKDRELAVEALRGGTEEDVHRFEELVSTPAFQESAAHASRMMRAFNMKMQHEARTGHKVNWNPLGI